MTDYKNPKYWNPFDAPVNKLDRYRCLPYSIQVDPEDNVLVIDEKSRISAEVLFISYFRNSIVISSIGFAVLGQGKSRLAKAFAIWLLLLSAANIIFATMSFNKQIIKYDQTRQSSQYRWINSIAAIFLITELVAIVMMFYA